MGPGTVGGTHKIGSVSRRRQRQSLPGRLTGRLVARRRRRGPRRGRWTRPEGPTHLAPAGPRSVGRAWRPLGSGVRVTGGKDGDSGAGDPDVVPTPTRRRRLGSECDQGRRHGGPKENKTKRTEQGSGARVRGGSCRKSLSPPCRRLHHGREREGQRGVDSTTTTRPRRRRRCGVPDTRAGRYSVRCTRSGTCYSMTKGDGRCVGPLLPEWRGVGEGEIVMRSGEGPLHGGRVR